MKKHFFATFFFLLLGGPAAWAAGIQVDLVNSTLTGAPGDIVKFFGTLTNVSATDTIFLNGASTTSASPFLTIDTSPFFLNAPLFLDPGMSSLQIELFDIAIDPATPSGPYPGSTVSILGGLDSGASDDLADAGAEVDVSAPSSVPEPGSWKLSAAGLALLAWGAKRKLGRTARSA
jgi:hypothetical protein